MKTLQHVTTQLKSVKVKNNNQKIRSIFPLYRKQESPLMNPAGSLIKILILNMDQKHPEKTSNGISQLEI